MRSLPVIYRELQVASRRPATYRQRLLVGGVGSAAVVIFALFAPLVQSGHALFSLVSWSLFVFCILEGLRETSDCLAQERREGTLGLLFLTDLRGYDVVLGKLAAAAVKSFTALLALSPAFMLPLWLGGVTARDCWRVMLALAATLLLSITAGLFVSALSKSAFAALLAAFLLILSIMLLPAMCIWSGLHLPGWTAGPLEMFLRALKDQSGLVPDTFWQAALYSAILCGVLIWLSGRALSRMSHAEPDTHTSGWWQRLLRPSVGLSESWGGSPSNEPAVWLAERILPGRKILWILLGTATLACFLVGAFAGNKAYMAYFPMQILFGILIKLWVAVLAVQPFNSARRSGALELILCTPMLPSALVRGQMDALRAYFFAPGLVAAFGLTMAGSLGSEFFYPNSTGEEMMPGMLIGLMWWLVFLLDMNALAYTGLWFGLTEPQIPQAVTKTVFRILILPWLTLLIPILGFFGMFIWPWIWMAWAGKNLKDRFHEEAANQFSTETAPPGWFIRKANKIFNN